jgi:hypothetical protein
MGGSRGTYEKRSYAYIMIKMESADEIIKKNAE